MLLGRHVAGRAHDVADARQRRVEAVGARAVGSVEDVVVRDLLGDVGPREAEVEHADAPVLAHVEVARLHVAVDEPRAVRRGEPLAGRDHDAQDLGRRGLLDEEPRPERRALDELGREEHVAVEGPDVVHRDDVRVLQARQGLGFTQEAGAAPLRVLAAARAGVEELQRDGALELRVVGLVDDAHAALARAVDDDVAAHDRAAAQGRAPVGKGGGGDGVGRRRGVTLGGRGQGGGEDSPRPPVSRWGLYAFVAGGVPGGVAAGVPVAPVMAFLAFLPLVPRASRVALAFVTASATTPAVGGVAFLGR